MNTMKRIVIVAGREAGSDASVLAGCSCAGFATQSCRDGLEALLTFTNLAGNAAAVISEVRMPEFNGAWLVRQVRMLNIEVPVILTGSYTEVDLWQVYDIGADAFIPRPAEAEAFGEMLYRLTSPPARRWGSRNVAVDNSIDLTVPVSPCGDQLAGFRPGRHGFSLDSTDDSLRRGQLVTFSLRQEGRQLPVLHGTGVVRWIRTAHADAAKRTVGVEFTWLDQESRSWLSTYISAIRPAAAIPASTSPTMF